jgi:CDGSH-type Zn-finger protein
MDNQKAIVAQPFPTEVALEAGKTYAWCTCGHSLKQPMCDGAHKTIEDLPFKSHRFEVPTTGNYWLCQCKQTKTPPFCDGSHKQL